MCLVRASPSLLVLYAVGLFCVRASLAQPVGRTHAVVIGVHQYQDVQAIPWLKHAQRDAQLFADHLKSERGGKLDSVTLFTNQNATQANILNSLREVLTVKATPLDTVYIFVSGRGRAAQGSADAYILTTIVARRSRRAQQSDYRYSSAISADRGSRVVLFADVCREPVESRFETESTCGYKNWATRPSLLMAYSRASRRSRQGRMTPWAGATVCSAFSLSMVCRDARCSRAALRTRMVMQL